ncbi:hypothetical protein KY332_03030 [Candidatus Woesearchaeota archaeon]|nr:hypothetical protein [Candidatus Woesearchaeota archaeon]
MMEENKAQVWYTDFMIGIMIFFIVIMIYFAYAHNVSQDPNEITSELLMDAKAISSSLVTQGSPSDWNQSNVNVIGITDGDQRLVQEKLDMFVNMTYSQAKTKLRTPYDFYFYLEDLEGNRISLGENDWFGKNASNADNAVFITRVVVYESELINMVVNVWQG